MRRKEEQEQLQLANALSRILLSGRDAEGMATEITLELKQLLSVDWAAACLINADRSAFHILPFLPRNDAALDIGAVAPLDDSPLRWVVSNQKALLQKDLSSRSRFATDAAWARKGIRTLAHMPLFSDGRVFGALVFGSRRPRAYGDRELRLLRYATVQMTSPIRHASRFARILREPPPDDTAMHERIDRIERALQDFAGAMETYARHLSSHTDAVISLDQVSERLRQAAAEQNRILQRLAAMLEENRLPPRRDRAPKGAETGFPAGCIMNLPRRGGIGGLSRN